MPWLSVRKNFAFVVLSKWPDWPDAKVGEQVEEYVEMVGLKHASDKKPAALSGGMKQRVGVTPAFAIERKMLLLDLNRALATLYADRAALEEVRLVTPDGETA